VRSVFAETKKKVLKKGRDLKTVINEDPADLDPSRLEITPLEDFDTMGTTDYRADMDTWRLDIGGEVKTPRKFDYKKIIALPKMEKDVLLICPGFFAQYGKWKGFSAAALLKECGLKENASHVEFSGPEGEKGRTARFSLKEVMSGKVFLAYEVNGVPLPRKHGFPLRVVAEDHYGSTWIKYVDTIRLIES
jgi:sulfoxide reductase catalytic subunit YedY